MWGRGQRDKVMKYGDLNLKGIVSDSDKKK